MIVLVGSFSYTPEGRFSDEFLLRCHVTFSEEFFCTLLLLVLVRSFSYAPHASSCEKFYTFGASISEEFILHS